MELITSYHIQRITLRITTTNIITMASMVKVIIKKNKLLIMGITTETLSTNTMRRRGEEGRRTMRVLLVN